VFGFPNGDLSEFGIPNARTLLHLHNSEDAFRQSLHGRAVERRGTICLPKRFPKVEFGGKSPDRVHARTSRRRRQMLKFIGGTIGVIFLIGLAVVVLLLMLIF
jgi:hypothetical protein